MNIYSAKAEERRKQFNRIINGCNMVLMNNIVEVDSSVWENWQGKSPNSDCDIVPMSELKPEAQDSNCDYFCQTHETATDEAWQCEEYQETEVYQWFAVSDSDADFLKRHNQYVTYSDMLDTYFLAICHFGTSWDYTSMVDDFENCYVGLDELDDKKEVV
jgi:hypothetical protein